MLFTPRRWCEDGEFFLRLRIKKKRTNPNNSSAAITGTTMLTIRMDEEEEEEEESPMTPAFVSSVFVAATGNVQEMSAYEIIIIFTL